MWIVRGVVVSEVNACFAAGMGGVAHFRTAMKLVARDVCDPACAYANPSPALPSEGRGELAGPSGDAPGGPGGAGGVEFRFE